MATDRNVNIDISLNVSGEQKAVVLNQNLEKLTNTNAQLLKSFNAVNVMAESFLSALVIKKIFDFAEGSIKLANAQQLAEKQFTQAAQAVGKYSASFDNATKQMANNLQALTGYEDDVVLGANKVLIGFSTISQKSLPQATKAALDWARFTGKSVDQAAQDIGKASTGMVDGLRRYGVEITKAQVDSEGLAAVLDAISKKAGGQAELFGKEFAGEVIKLNNTFGDLREELGYFITDAIQSADVLGPITKSIQDLITRFQQGDPALESFKNQLTKVFSVVGSVIKFAIDHVDALARAFKLLTTISIGLLLSKLANLTTAFFGMSGAINTAATASSNLIATNETLIATNERLIATDTRLISTEQFLNSALATKKILDADVVMMSRYSESVLGSELRKKELFASRWNSIIEQTQKGIPITGQLATAMRHFEDSLYAIDHANVKTVEGMKNYEANLKDIVKYEAEVVKQSEYLNKSVRTTAVSFGYLNTAITTIMGANIGWQLGQWADKIGWVNKASWELGKGLRIIIESFKAFPTAVKLSLPIVGNKEELKKFYEEFDKTIKEIEAITSGLTAKETQAAFDETLEQQEELLQKLVVRRKDAQLKVVKDQEVLNETILKLNIDLTEKLYKLTMSEYDFSRHVIEKELKENLKSGADKTKSVELYHQQIRELDEKTLQANLKYIEDEKNAIISSIGDREKRQQKAFDDYQTSLDEISKQGEKYFEDQRTYLSSLIDKWLKLADQVQDASVDIANYTIKNRETFDKFFPSTSTIKAFETTSADTIEKVIAARDKLLKTTDITAAQEVIINQAAALKIQQINKEMMDNLYSGWKNLTDSVANDFTSAFEKIAESGEISFKTLADLGKMLQQTLAKIAADLVKQQFIQPIMDQVRANITGQAVGNVLPSNFQGPIQSGGQTKASPYANYAMGGVMALSTGYSLYQQQQQGTLSPISGGIQGAMAGAAIGSIVPVVGTALGGVVGGLAGMAAGLFSKHEKKIEESINTLWEVIDGEVVSVSSKSKHLSETQVRDIELSIQKAIDSQLEYFTKIATLFGAAQPTFNLSLIQKGLISTEGLSVSAQTKAFLTQFTTQAKIVGTANIEEFTKLVEPAIKRVYGSFNNFANEYRFLIAEANKENNVYWTTSLPAAIAKLGNETQTQLQEYFDSLNTQLQEMFDFLSPSVSDAIKSGLNSSDNGVGIFTNSLAINLADAIKSAVIQGVAMQNILPSLLQTFGELTDATTGQILRPSLQNALQQLATNPAQLSYIDQQLNVLGGKPIQTTYTGQGALNKILESMLTDFNTNIETLAPAFETLTDIMAVIDKSLGLNTEAITTNTEITTDNTDAIRGPMEKYLEQLTFGSASAGGYSIALLQEHSDKLFEASAANSEEFSKYADFMLSTYLPNIQGITEKQTGTLTDYQKLIEAEKVKITNLPAWLSTGGTAYTPEKVADLNAQAIARQLLPALQDIKNNQKIVVQTIVDGQIVKEEIYQALTNDVDTQQVIKQVVNG